MYKTVSIVTVSLNQGEFIGSTIRSVLSQSGDFYIDYIIIDGGSSDQSVQVIEKFGESLKKNCSIGITDQGLERYTAISSQFPYAHCRGVTFRWSSEKDQGQVDALKKGFDLAYGDIYCWLNSDDIFSDNDVLSRVLKHFSDERPPEILTGDGLLIDRDGNQTGRWHVDKINFKELIFLDYHILQPSTFFINRVYQPDYLLEKFICAFDADFFIHLIKEGRSLRKIDDTLSAFRIYPEIKTLKLSSKRFNESIVISRKYSRNLFYLGISLLFKYFSIILKPKFEGKLIFNILYPVIYSISYLLITGRPRR